MDPADIEGIWRWVGKVAQSVPPTTAAKLERPWSLDSHRAQQVTGAISSHVA